MRYRIAGESQIATRRRLAICLALSLAMSTIGPVIAKDAVESRDFPVHAYSGVSIQFPADVVIRTAAKDSLSISAEPKVLAALRVQVKDGTLVLESNSFQTSKPVKVRIDVKQFKSLQVGSSGDISVKDVSTEHLVIASNASATIAITGLVCDSLKLTALGSESIQIRGRAKTFELTAEGSSDIDAGKFEAKSVAAKVSGASSATVNSTTDLRAIASDSGTIRYHGGGRITKRVTDAAEVTRVN